MPTIDLNARFGSYPARHRTMPFEQLADDARALEIDASVVCSTTGVYYNDVEGNLETIAASVKLPRQLIPAATINPVNTLDPERTVAEIAAGPFRMARFFPSEQGWPIDFAPFTQCLRLLGERKLPVMISCTRLGDATRIARQLKEIPSDEFSVILEGVTTETIAEVLAATREAPSLMVETHALVSADVLMALRGTVGAERIVYGSGASALSLGASLYYIHGSVLSDDEKLLVLGGNAARVLKLKL